MARPRYLDPGLRKNRPFLGMSWRLNAANDNGQKFDTIGAGNVVGDERSLSSLGECISEFRLYPDGSRMGKPFSGQFVYIVGSLAGDSVKIGKAVDPISRLASIQTGNPEKLFIHRAFYFATTKIASRVEHWSHEIASERHGRLEGEWFRCDPMAAHEVVMEAAHEERASYCVVTPIPNREAA